PSENSGDVRQASPPQNARTAQSQHSAQHKGRPKCKKEKPCPVRFKVSPSFMISLREDVLP
ncbi:TPA: hypothetical protein ACFNMZ_002094, partial [Neisseria polysaccharea]